MTIIHWFRHDLRLSDNPALTSAAQDNKIFPIYILDDENADEHKMGAASRVWLHHSLGALRESLGGDLRIFKGDAKKIIERLIDDHQISAVYWNRCYEPWRVARDKDIKSMLQDNDIKVYSFNGSLLWEPWDVLKDNGTPYKVFTPFYRNKCLKLPLPRDPLPKPISLMTTTLGLTMKDHSVEMLGLLPDESWGEEIVQGWKIGEKAAQDILNEFLDDGIDYYKEGRNYPAKKAVSRLSPYLHYGEISPNQAWYAARNYGDTQNVDTFCSELGWREFSYALLYHFPDLPHKNLQEKFDVFPWRKDTEALERWKTGMTGYPIVDAGMRELWQTGYMHNRVRMIVASFLVKNLLLHWHEGEAWFWDCLVDADLANNSASWQWVAGSGADAAPYFRIFNPVTQGQKFDAKGEYTRRYVPELSNVPDKYLFNPWEAPDDVMDKAGINLGHDYPEPIVDLKLSRERALSAYNAMKDLFSNGK